MKQQQQSERYSLHKCLTVQIYLGLYLFPDALIVLENVSCVSFIKRLLNLTNITQQARYNQDQYNKPFSIVGHVFPPGGSSITHKF